MPLLKRCLMVLALLLSLWPAATLSDELTQLKILTESYPPYNFVAQDQLRGISVDLLMAAADAIGSSLTRQDIALYPWPRAYKTALKGPQVALFSTTMTADRKPLFQWVGPIIPTRVVLLARRDKHIRINSLQDINPYAVGVIREDIGEQLLLAGQVAEKNIRPLSSAVSLAKMLNSGRIDLWAYEENVARWILRNNKLNPENFESVYILDESELYYTFSKDVDPALLQRLQQALTTLRSTPLYQTVIDRYL